MALAEFRATQTTAADYADVVRPSDPSSAVNAPHSDLQAVLGPLECTGAVSYILQTGNATGGCDYEVFGTNDDPTLVTPIWAEAHNSDGSAAAGTAPASATTAIFEVDHAHHRAYKVQVRFHSGGSAQAVTLIGVAKG